MKHGYVSRTLELTPRAADHEAPPAGLNRRGGAAIREQLIESETIKPLPEGGGA